MELKRTRTTRPQKVVSMYKTGNAVQNLNYSEIGEIDYPTEIRFFAGCVANEPVIRDTVDWMVSSQDWLSEFSKAQVFRDLKPQIRQLQVQRQRAIDQARSSLHAAAEMTEMDDDFQSDVEILQQFLQDVSLHVADVLTLDLTLATQHLNEVMRQKQHSVQRVSGETSTEKNEPVKAVLSKWYQRFRR